MVVKYGQDAGQNSKISQETSTERDNANFHTSFFVSDTGRTSEGRQPEFSISANNIQSTHQRKADFGYPTPELTDVVQTNHAVPAYANMNYMSVDNEVSLMTENNRPAIVVLRTSSADSTGRQNSPRNSMKYESEYECMSSPESFSNSSSNRSSNTSSFYGNISPDTLSLASFAGRFNIGRFSTGSKRSSQSSSASSQDSGPQSWGKVRDSFDLSDGIVSSFRRPSGEHVYENTRPFTPDNFMRFSRVEANHMEVTDQDEDSPPPLPTRQNQQPVSTPAKEEPEMILPYKVVDLDELQRSLEDIEPYYIHNGPERPEDVGSYKDVPDPMERDNEPDSVSTVHGDFRPELPPKKRPLSHSQSDTCFDVTKVTSLSKERPTLLPRQSLILSDLAHVRGDGTVQTDENTNLAERSMSSSGHVPRAKSPPSGSKHRQNSTSPHRNARPVRSAPPPPPRRSLSPSERVSSNRPVSEMFPHANSAKQYSPMALKRSHTVSLLQSPFSRRPVDSVGQKTGSGNPAQNLNNPPKTLSPSEPVDEKSKDDATKASKKGAFLKKALSNLKIPGTKKATKKELTIGPPSDFTSLYKTGLTTEFSNGEQETVSSLTSDDNCGDRTDCDSSAVVGEPAAKEGKSKKNEWEMLMEDPEEPMEQLSFHPEFTELPIIDVNPADEQFYYNFPISHADGTEKLPTPKKPPRSGYLLPSLSQLTKDREEEISRNIAPELGPLPTPPEGTSRPETPSASVISTPDSDEPALSTVDRNKSVVVTPEDPANTVTTPESENKKENNGKVEKPSRKPKPDVPCRPSTLKLKPKVPNRPVFQSTDKPTPIPRSLTLDTATIQKSREMSASRIKDRRHSTPLEEAAGLSRSCDSLGNYEEPRNDYIANMHLTVIKDILRCWRNMLRKPMISLAGACWEDFEIIESDSPQKVSEDLDSVSMPVRLRKESTNLDSNNCCGKYIAKIKCKTHANGTTKSCFDQDYSVCTSLEYHENISRVLAYFRGEIEPSMLGTAGNKSPLHTTISISDQVPTQTCTEFVAESKEMHSKEPLSYERTVCMLMLQCLRGIRHLHDSGFTHGDLNLNNLFLIKHNHDYQLFIGNFGKSQPLASDRRSSVLYSKIDDSPTELTSAHRNDFAAISEIFTAMLHLDQNGNGTHASKASYSSLSEYLRLASERLREGSVSSYQMICFLQALLWGPFKLGENIVIVSQSRMNQWLDGQRSEFIARLAMDEALARTAGGNSRKFCMEDLLLCEYLSGATASSLVRTEQCWFLAT